MTKKTNPRPMEVTDGHYLGNPVVFIPLTGGKSAMVDPEDWPRIKGQYGDLWYKNTNGRGRSYARRCYSYENGRTTMLTLQRAVMEAKPGQMVRVHSGNALDCRKVNLAFMDERDKRHLRRVHAR